MAAPEELDPRWEWYDISTYSKAKQRIRGACNHLSPIPVHAAGTGELVARLCPDCDTQLAME